MSASKQFPVSDGVKDVPAVPGSLYKANVPKLQSVGEVKDRNTPESVKGGKA